MMTATDSAGVLKKVVALQAAIAARSEADAEALCGELFEFDPKDLTEGLSDANLATRRLVHEALDDALRGFLLADNTGSELWQRLLLPAAAGVFTLPLWTANGCWLRACGSDIPDSNDERLYPAQLKRLEFAAQARVLGRYCIANDGARELDVAKVLNALDERLVPFFCSWLVGTHSQSPARLGTAEACANQESVLQQFLELWQDRDFDLAASPHEMGALYAAAYRERVDLPQLAKVVNGGALTNLLANLPRLPHSSSQWLDGLAPGAHVLIAPNWRDTHVSHRCLSPLLDGERERGATALLVHEFGKPPVGPVAGQWKSIEHELPGDAHYLLALGTAADAIAARDLEFAFFPEITPSNTSAWLATQRLARVQATGYGYPVTSGLPSMDYYVAGADIEDARSASSYIEQVVLLPGFGVSTTAPPLPSLTRERPLDDEHVRLVSTAGFRKLHPDLLRAWDQVLHSREHTSLEMFPAMSEQAAQRQAPALAAHLTHEEVTLHPSVRRVDILDQLNRADLYLDSFPFGGFNTLVEVVACGVPFVTFEGEDARSRFGAAILRRLEMPEFLIAHSWQDYVAAATRVLSDTGLRLELRARLADRERVLAALVDPDASAHFDAALEWMLERGPRNGEPAGPPMYIEAGQAPRPMPMSGVQGRTSKPTG